MRNEEYPGYTLVKDFHPSGSTFDFRLGIYDCYRRSEGCCSLEIEEGKQVTTNEFEKFRDSDVAYCPALVNSLIKYGVTNNTSPVRIIKNSCGHYSVEDGQHRLCSSAARKIPIDVYVQDNPYECCVCHFNKKSFKFKLKGLLGKNNEFLRKL